MSVKTLVAYYTWSGNTEEIAERIHHQLPGSDLFQIQVAANVFSKDMYKTSDIARHQLVTQEFPKLLGELPYFKQYGVILIGTPIWDNRPATPVHSFLQQIGRPYEGKIAMFYTSTGQDDKAGAVFEDWCMKACPYCQCLMPYEDEEGLKYWF
ncbi:MAG: hypothetical protein LKE17_03745 [Lactobacillus sp.]|jgi:flavodoxin|nr:hypothetical protein [Lactobacillus sp.]